MCLNGEDIARQSCAMVPRWRFFGESAMAEIRQGKKIERKKKREETAVQKYNGLSYYTGRP